MNEKEHYDKLVKQIENADHDIGECTSRIDSMFKNLDRLDPSELFATIETRGYAQGKRSVLMQCAAGYEKKAGIVGVGILADRAKREELKKFKDELMKDLGAPPELINIIDGFLIDPKNKNEPDDDEIEMLKNLIPDLPQA